jgi:DHA1 family bicyclomycin/chloramphenicol resistance-like MFS transporter
LAQTVRDPLSRGYTLALAATFSALIAYISSIQQIVFDVFAKGQLIGVVFGAVAAPMALASWLNSRVVGRYGLRRVGHTAAVAFALVTSTHAIIALSGHENLATFVVMQSLAMASFAFTSSNLGTLAMERMAPIAGTASSVQGVVGTLGAAIIGFTIGQAFDGTVVPYVVGCALSAIAALVIIALTEPRRLFAPIEKDTDDDLPTCVPDDLG